jgi:hypothetical protein
MVKRYVKMKNYTTGDIIPAGTIFIYRENKDMCMITKNHKVVGTYRDLSIRIKVYGQDAINLRFGTPDRGLCPNNSSLSLYFHVHEIVEP